MNPQKNISAEGEVVLILKAQNGKSEEMDPFDVGRTINDLVGHVKEAKTTRSGEYSLRVTSEQAKRLTKLKKLKSGLKIRCEQHPTKNVTKCVISHHTIAKIPDEKLLKEMKAQGVVEVRSMGKSGKLRVLTIKGTKTPPTLKIGPITIKTGTYYPMVRRCRKCQQIGHLADECNKAQRCGKCSGGHVEDQCTNDPFCGNCGGDHVPGDKTCPLLIQEKAVIKVHKDKKIKLSKARRLYRRDHPDHLLLPSELDGNGHFGTDDESTNQGERTMEGSTLEKDATPQPEPVDKPTPKPVGQKKKRTPPVKKAEQLDSSTDKTIGGVDDQDQGEPSTVNNTQDKEVEPELVAPALLPPSVTAKPSGQKKKKGSSAKKVDKQKRDSSKFGEETEIDLTDDQDPEPRSTPSSTPKSGSQKRKRANITKKVPKPGRATDISATGESSSSIDLTLD